MKIIILKETLDKVLPAICRVVAVRGQLPVLSNVLIKAEKTGICFSATNLELGIEMTVGGKVNEEGSITVPARSMAEFVALMRSREVFLETEGDKLKIVCGKSEGTFAGINSAEFPVLPAVTPAKEGRVMIRSERFEQVAGSVGYAASADEARLVLTGIKFYMAEKKVRAVATDGFRLARLDMIDLAKEKVEAWPENLIVPAKTIFELAKLVADGGKQELEMQVLKENNQIVFLGKEWVLVSRILEGNFPEVEKLIPNENKTQVVIDRKELIEGVKAAAIFARENSNIVKFEVKNSLEGKQGSLRVKAVGQQTGEETSDLEVEIEGEDLEIAFNYKYILDVLGSFGSEKVFFESNGPQLPGVFKEEGDGSLVALIMPVRV